MPHAIRGATLRGVCLRVTRATSGSNAYGLYSGYSSGGYYLSPSPARASCIIDKFPFASNANATNVGNLTICRRPTGQSSTVSGYTSGGYNQNVIDKFPFASDANATNVGVLTQNREQAAGQSSSVSGYTSGGTFAVTTFVNTIDKFPFAADANATDVGDLTVHRRGIAGQSSTVSGYSSGGQLSPPGINLSNIIDKFSFASDANATDVGDLTQSRHGTVGQSSSVSGYTSGGYSGPSDTNTIDKFPFASNANATDVGDLTTNRRAGGGQSSTVSGYTSGGASPTTVADNTIDKFPFASNANATDVGDLTQSRSRIAGQQI